ncbi:MAG: PadR family transcriptional regulator [Candidatus Didemnitutus sp.]|nr:PadR family transcriptional regulator [Candidatus Didemnitutus sp.]
MKNRTLLVLALMAANDRWGQPAVLRTVLVKQAFLAETIRPLYGVWLRTFGFVRYHYGPWSAEIFKRLDTLICNGLVEVIKAEQRGGKMEAHYRITHAGHRVLAQFADSDLVPLATDLVWALQTLGVEQATTICKLVYEEAEFARLFAEHQAAGIGAETQVPLPAVTAANNETFTTLAILQALMRRGKDLPALAPRDVVRIFLKSLAAQLPSANAAKGAAA